MESDEKKCPHCAEQVKADATKCKHCGENPARPPKSKAEKAKSTQKVAFFWLAVLIGASFFVSKNTGSNSAEATEEEHSRQAIDLCWNNVDDKLAGLDARRAMRDSCKRMVQLHAKKYGNTHQVRTD